MEALMPPLVEKDNEWYESDKKWMDKARKDIAEELGDDDLDPRDVLNVFDEHIDDFAYQMLPKQFCPICSLDWIQSHDMLAYVLKQTGRGHDEVVTEIRNSFADSPDEFFAFIKE